MLVTTSRRPSHRARLLGRELIRVLPNAEYVPRGIKTVRRLASLASSRGHELVMIVNSRERQPRELRFLNASVGWRWLDARIELREVELQRDLGQKVRLADVRIVAADSARAQNLARLLSELWGLPLSEGPSSTGAVVLVTCNDGLKVQFRAHPKDELVGPVLYVKNFGE